MSDQPRGRILHWLPWLGVCAVLLYLVSPSLTRQDTNKDKGQPDRDKGPLKTSYDQVSPVLLGEESFQAMYKKDKEAKEGVMARQQKLLEERYNLAAHVDNSVKMSRGKPIPVGPATKL